MLPSPAALPCCTPLLPLRFELGLACTMLGQYETNQQEDKLGLIFSKLGETADSLSSLLTQKVERDQVDVVEQLRTHVRVAESVKLMIKTRQQAQTRYNDCLARLSDKQKRAEAAKGPEVAALEKQVLEAQAQVDNEKEELARVTQLCLAEAAQYREDKKQELKSIAIAYVRSQIEHSRKAQKAWEGMLPHLEH